MATAQIVSPDHSQDEYNRGLAHLWFEKVQEGIHLTTADWHAVAEEKSTLPLLDDLDDEIDQPVLIRCTGMVQDMLESGYCQVGDAMIEQTPLVIVPIPQVTPWFRQIVYDSVTEHRDKRLCSKRRDENNDDAMEVTTNAVDEKTVVANFYYEQYVNQPKLLLNELVEIVGVMERKQDDVDMEDPGALLPHWDDEPDIPYNMLRLQVLWYRKIDLDQSILPPLQLTDISPNDDVAAVLSKALSIDKLTSTAIWMALLSLAERQPNGAPTRTPQATTLGCASLSIILPNASACHKFQERLDKILSSVLPLLVKPLLPLLKLPRKENGRLNPNPLQLPKGGTVILNASEIQPGPVSGDALSVLQTVQELTSSHQIPYNFDGGVTIHFEADVRVIVLCTAETRTLFPCMLQVKCNPGSDAENSDFSESTWQTIREHLATVRSGKTIELPMELLDEAQQEFLRRRQEARQRNLTVDEVSFHRWLTLTRLTARGRRSDKAAVSDWKNALQLDDAMLASLS